MGCTVVSQTFTYVHSSLRCVTCTYFILTKYVVLEVIFHLVWNGQVSYLGNWRWQIIICKRESENYGSGLWVPVRTQEHPGPEIELRRYLSYYRYENRNSTLTGGRVVWAIGSMVRGTKFCLEYFVQVQDVASRTLRRHKARPSTIGTLARDASMILRKKGSWNNQE